MSQYIFDSLKHKGVDIFTQHQVRDITKIENSREIDIRDTENKKNKQFTAKFVFIGAGGGALPLLQKSGIPEAQ